MAADARPEEQETGRMTPPISIADVVERQGFTRFQLLVVVLCGAVIFVEGFDAQAVGYVAPSMTEALRLQQGALGPVLGAAIAGLMLGGFLLAPLADRVGRRKVIICSTVSFGLLSMATPLFDSVVGLVAIRFLTGLGLGSAMPNVIALTAEYSPRRINGLVVMIMFSGFSLGSAGGGFVAAHLVADYGWQSIFLVGGALPLFLAPALMAWLPESPRFLALRHDGQAAAIRLLARIDPGVAAARDIALALEERSITAMSARAIFSGGRVIGTLMLWVIFAMSLLDIALVASWLPTALNAGGASLRLAALTGSLFQLGGIVGTFAMGLLIDRTRPEWLLAGAYLLGAICMGMIAHADPLTSGMLVIVTLAGFGIVGGQIAANALAARFYPTPIRSTGIGWAFGVGRFGSLAGPLLGGTLLGAGLPPADLFLLSVGPTLLAAAASLGLMAGGRRSEESAAAQV